MTGPVSSKPVTVMYSAASSAAQPKATNPLPASREQDSLESLSQPQKGPSAFFTCIKRFFEILFFPFIWLYNVLFPSSAAKTPQEEPSAVSTPQEIVPPIVPSEEIRSKFPTCSVEENIDPYAYEHHIHDQNKLAAYNRLLPNGLANYKLLALDKQPITFYKYTLQDRSYVSSRPLFQMSPAKGKVYCRDGLIPYGNKHCVANFADQHIMGYCNGPLFAQDEAQVVVHPHLYHIRTALVEKGHEHMQDNEIYLLKNVTNLGRFDNMGALYGNKFSQATPEQVTNGLFFDPLLGNSNIFFIAAPHISAQLAHKPYQKMHLEQLFYTAYTAFFGIKEQFPDKSDVHTGNWGAGAFGNSAKVAHLIQIAAARAAGVNVHLYPLDSKADCVAAQALFNQIENQHPNMTIDQFLTHLTENANQYQLFYGIGNGT